MTKQIRQYLLIGALAGATAIALPARAQQNPGHPGWDQDQQNQIRQDQDDQNRQINKDQDQVRRDEDQNQQVNPDRDQVRRDQNESRQYQDRDRDRAYNNGNYDQSQWVNTKAYRMGLKDGEHDRSKNKGERANKKHWKNDQDRQAYEAGYTAGYRGNQAENNGRERNEQHR